MTVLTGVPTETLQTYLADARSALHKLLTGQRAVTVAHDGRSVTYTAADHAALRAYIAELQTALGLSSGRRPARFVVG
ncbi:MAG: gpW family head-tail joining protein [Pseudomonadota bacterium]